MFVLYTLGTFANVHLYTNFCIRTFVVRTLYPYVLLHTNFRVRTFAYVVLIYVIYPLRIFAYEHLRTYFCPFCPTYFSDAYFGPAIAGQTARVPTPPRQFPVSWTRWTTEPVTIKHNKPDQTWPNQTYLTLPTTYNLPTCYLLPTTYYPITYCLPTGSVVTGSVDRAPASACTTSDICWPPLLVDPVRRPPALRPRHTSVTAWPTGTDRTEVHHLIARMTPPGRRQARCVIRMRPRATPPTCRERPPSVLETVGLRLPGGGGGGCPTAARPAAVARDLRYRHRAADGRATGRRALGGPTCVHGRPQSPMKNVTWVINNDPRWQSPFPNEWKRSDAQKRYLKICHLTYNGPVTILTWPHMIDIKNGRYRNCRYCWLHYILSFKAFHLGITVTVTRCQTCWIAFWGEVTWCDPGSKFSHDVRKECPKR